MPLLLQSQGHPSGGKRHKGQQSSAMKLGGLVPIDAFGMGQMMMHPFMMMQPMQVSLESNALACCPGCGWPGPTKCAGLLVGLAFCRLPKTWAGDTGRISRAVKPDREDA